MRFRFCCTCRDGGESKPAENPIAPSPQSDNLPPIITQQPRCSMDLSQIPLDKITEDVSIEESTVIAPGAEEELTPVPLVTSDSKQVSANAEPTLQTPIRESTKEEPNNESSTMVEIDGLQFSNINEAQRKVLTEIRDMLLADKAAKAANPLPIQSKPTSKQKSNIEIITTIDGDKLILNQIVPDLYQGTFKGLLFYILEGIIYDSSGFLNEPDKVAIKHVYNEAMTAMQRGMKEMAGGYSALKDQEAWNPPPGSAINTNFITRKGMNAVMTFKFIGQGNFRSTYEGKDFVILNGNLLVDESFDEFDRQLIMQTYNNTLLGMQQGLMGMERGMKTMEMASSMFASARGKVAGIHNTSFNLTTGHETLRDLHSTNHDGESIAKPQQPVMVIEDITDDENTPKKRRNFDQTDGSTLTEPVLQKTTFNPQAIIYDDPKTYDEQDKNELPLAKRNDEYIISPDANFDSTNRYHFHKARPKRVIRPKLTAKEKFRFESPEKYSLFEDQCLKLHNQYRKLHGVPPLVHNEFLAQVAKEWAEHLALKNAFYHRPKNEYGENLYCAERMPCCARMAVKAWYDEIDLYDYENPKLSKEVGHFTQLVWKDTREVGTGVAQIGDKVWVCCNYHPPGNYLDKINEEFIPRPLENLSKKY